MRQLKISKQVTNREAPSLDKYLQDISKMELISVEEEVQLAKRIRGGDDAALERLINANLRFVISVAKQYQNQGLSLQDLINEGNLGLIKAAKRFDETRGFKFISYAVWWIRQSILQALAEQARIVRLPLNKISSINKINRTLSILEQQFEREPTSEEVGLVLDMLPKDIKLILRSSGRHLSLDAPLLSDEDGTLYDLLLVDENRLPDRNLIMQSLQKEIDRAIHTLTFREAYVLRHYYGLNGRKPSTLEEIGERLELTRERVRQIKERALRRIKNTNRGNQLKSFLGD